MEASGWSLKRTLHFRDWHLCLNFAGKFCSEFCQRSAKDGQQISAGKKRTGTIWKMHFRLLEGSSGRGSELTPALCPPHGAVQQRHPHGQTLWHFPCRMRAEQHLVLDDKNHHMLRACSLPSPTLQTLHLCTIPRFSLSVFLSLCETPAFINHFVTKLCMYFVLPHDFFLSFLAWRVIPNAAFQQHFQMCKSPSSLRYFCQHDWELRLTADYHHPAPSFCWSFTIQKSDACLPLSTGESSFLPVCARNIQLSRNAVIK